MYVDNSAWEYISGNLLFIYSIKTSADFRHMYDIFSFVVDGGYLFRLYGWSFFLSSSQNLPLYQEKVLRLSLGKLFVRMIILYLPFKFSILVTWILCIFYLYILSKLIIAMSYWSNFKLFYILILKCSSYCCNIFV